MTGSDQTGVVSVIVPTHGRPERLQRLLASLQAQTLPITRYEVIIIDDGSPPQRRPDESMLCAGNQQLVRQTQRGPAAARNAGAHLAQTGLLVFTDDDCEADGGWLAGLLAAHQAAPDALLGGYTENGLVGNVFSALAESLLQFFDEEAQRNGKSPDFLASNNVACSREAFVELGGFDTAYPLAAGEDRDFCRRWLASHRPIQRCTAARVRHYHALSLRGFWRQQRNYGRGAARFHASQGARAAGLPQPTGFYVRLLLHPLWRSAWPVWQRLLSLPLTALSQCAIAVGMISEKRDRNRSDACIGS